MNLKYKLFLILLAALVPQSSVFADAQKGEAYLTVLGTYYNDDTNRGVDDDLGGIRIGLGYALSERWNLEGVLSRIDAGGDEALGTPGQRQFTIGADLQYVIARASRFSPYLFAGFSNINVEVNDIDHTGLAWSGGVGVRADLSSSSRDSLQIEYRYRTDDALGPDLHDQIFSIGVHIPFGGRQEIAAPAIDGDSDGDGVRDSMDRCPDTPAGVSVDSSGCPLDSDGDGVADNEDECPNTVRGATVDAKGCELDGDNDGVVDRLDKCPDTRAGAQVDIAGCEIREEIQLRGVNFESNSDRLLPGAESVLNDAAASLVRNPSIKVEVAGHTDSDGAADYNESLSARRAATVRDYLVGQGVGADRMTTRGYGESQPIADNTSAEGKANNRRVVLTITDR